jgi:hypothetical protein
MLDDSSINILPSEEESDKEESDEENEVIGHIGTYSGHQVALYCYRATDIISSLSI